MPVILGKFEIVVPEVLEDSFNAGCISSALAAGGTVFAYVGLAFELAAAITIGCGVT